MSLKLCWKKLATALGAAFMAPVFVGCQMPQRPNFNDCGNPCSEVFQQIEYADVQPDACGFSPSGGHLLTGEPLTVRNWHEMPSRPMSLEEAVETALANNKVLQKLGGQVLSAPQATATAYDPALLETDPNRSAEAALAAFDAQFFGNATLNHSERKFNNLFFGGGAVSQIANVGNLTAGISKYAANGSQFRILSTSDYQSNNAPVNRFRSVWDQLLTAEVRQPLARGAGTAVTRIAGANPVPGAYNGVLIGRITGDVALADFEAAVRNLTRDVEQAYWELYFAYRDIDIKNRARDAALKTWEQRKRRVDAGLSRIDEEAQARQQYYQFEQQVIDALSGNQLGQTGVLGAERQLRRLLGMVNNDGALIRPTSEPTIAPIRFDWDQSQELALMNRVELRRQKWIIRQRELELCAAKMLNKWQVDLIGNYSARGFGDDLIGNSGVPEGSAFSDLFTGQLDDWGFGIEVAGPVGNRRSNLAIRNAELRLVREKSLLEEQQKQLLLDLNAAWTEVDRAYAAIRIAFNARAAAMEELRPKQERADKGEEEIFFVLDAQQRAANAESTFHRAVVNYNLALMNYVFTAGGLLEHYNIQLVEDEWIPGAYSDAATKNAKYRFGEVNPASQDVYPTSAGPVDQTTDVLSYEVDSVPTAAPIAAPFEEGNPAPEEQERE